MRTVVVALHAVVWVLGIGALWPSATLWAQEPEDRERGAIAFGAFINKPATQVSVDGEASDGTDINLEDDLNIDSSLTVLRIGGHWWLSRRNRLDFSLFNFNREGSRTIDETINFGDETFAINTVVTSESDVSVAKAAYTFAPIIKDRGYLGFTAGLYVSTTKISLSTPNQSVSESKDLTAPLPVIGLRGQYEFADRFTLRGAFEWFGIEVEDVKGTLQDRYVAVDYGFGDRFAVGLAYNDVFMDLSAEDAGFRGSLDWGYDGWLLYMNIDFGNR